MPENFEIDPEKEFDVIEKLYDFYKKLEVKLPIKAKNVQQNPCEMGSPLLNSAHPDHRRVFSQYLKSV